MIQKDMTTGGSERPGYTGSIKTFQREFLFDFAIEAIGSFWIGRQTIEELNGTAIRSISSNPKSSWLHRIHPPAAPGLKFQSSFSKKA